MPIEPPSVALDGFAAGQRPSGAPHGTGGSAVAASARTGPGRAGEAARANPAGSDGRRPRRVASHELFIGAADELEIVHGAWIYRLRRTAQGKLILTK